MNAEIRVPEVLLINEGGETVGTVATPQALQMASEKGLDLVEVAPLAKPPVCKILDFGNFVYKQKKLEKKQKRQQKQVEPKTIRLSIRTDTHDLETKARQTQKFIEKRHVIRVVLIFRGREMAHRDLGIEKMNLFYKMLESVATIEQAPKLQGNQLLMILNPIK
ncbi:translation initiation factor IF-3 [Candidatus Peregrinibacteria bacterium]|nr:translation initiation factor IF-3 [Candidatus Peregrinibacteria bacterium]